MTDIINSISSGLFWIIILFVCCFLIVLGGRIIYLTAKEIITQSIKKQSKVSSSNKKAQRKAPAQKPPAPVRSIEINPDDVDRIYVRKSS